MATRHSDTGRHLSGRLSSRVPAWSRFVVAAPVLGLFVGSVTLVALASLEVVRAVRGVLRGELAKLAAVLEFIEIADVFLLATVLYIMALGLYQLFIDDSLPLPGWLEVHTLDDLKEKLVSVVVVVMAVLFLGYLIGGAPAEELMQRGVGIALVTAALGYFLAKKAH